MRKGEAGTAAVEMVLVAPALLLVLSLVVGAGRVVATKEAVLDVAREAARIAAEAPDASTARAQALRRAREVAAGIGLDPNRLIVGVQPGTFARGEPYTVRVSYRVRLADLPVFGHLPGSFVVSARQTELVERFKSR